jgi:hypothetical protein
MTIRECEMRQTAVAGPWPQQQQQPTLTAPVSYDEHVYFPGKEEIKTAFQTVMRGNNNDKTLIFF